ncbi:MAG TPA: 6-oxocyclohex-1-ene-1-carbonyl-CoA hydratase [Candidatus Omnitrophota bacterium]|jgi:6-oxo-cyclohex-1-ene-carbonyl-CoA hydrolase|nr:6-oxocyclohex-1-ene-1-carbonyl-CoA hydratase [Candidatus Omnitrophota bacterium]
MLKNHTLFPEYRFQHIGYEMRPALDPCGRAAEGLFHAWIVLDNPKQLNSYTTDMAREVGIAFRQASLDRRVVSVVFTATGDKSFCTGGNTEEYATYYAGNPQEYKQYMRVFNDMIDAILACDKPVVNRVNGMRIGGGQEIGMACDFSIAADTARFGQAGPKHGSAPDGGSTDFLPVYVGFGRAIESAVLCETWSAHRAMFLGLVNEVVPVLRVDGRWIPNPLVVTDRFLDEMGRIVYGDFRTGPDLALAKETFARAKTDLSLLDKAVEALCAKLLMLMPDCTAKTVASLRKHKLHHWQANSGTNRDWLALNMMTEARAGFRAFHEGPKGRREVDFIRLRQMLAEGHPWDDELYRAISPQCQPPVPPGVPEPAGS